MPDGTDYLIKDIIRKLELSLIGTRGKAKILIKEVVKEDIPKLQELLRQELLRKDK